MRVYALSGGIATGKSTALALFESHRGVAVFDADTCVHSLYQNSQFREQLLAFDVKTIANGEIQKTYLRERVFRDQSYKGDLEALIHPLVRKECLAKLENSRKLSSVLLFIADIPLLFENGFDIAQEANLVVATSAKTQRQRFIDRNKFSESVVSAMLEAQLPIAHKVGCADVVFWNEGDTCLLEHQIKRFIEWKI